MTKKRFHLFLLLLLMLLTAVCVLGGCKKKKEYRNIRITEITGEVTVKRAGQDDLEAYVNMNLQSDDELITAKGAKVTLCLDDDKFVVVDEDSKLVLIAAGTKDDSKTRIELEYGAVFSDIKDKLSENSEYEVITPSSTMSVRGTQFEVVYREIKDEAGKLLEKVMKVLTFEGEVAVKPEGSKEKRITKAGSMNVIVEKEEGVYTFEGATKQIEAEDLSELSATYLKEELSQDAGDLSAEEKAWREELSQKLDEYFETVAPVVKPYNRSEHLYQLVSLDGRSWEEIKAFCEANGGHLATISCAEENEYIYDQMVAWGYEYAYFGYSDEETEGEWKWVTGEKKSYENWYEEDIDNFRAENYAMLWIYRPYHWNDGALRETEDVAFVIEWEMKNGVLPTPIPEPTPTPTLTPTPAPTPTTAPENTDRIRLDFYFSKVIAPLETYQVSGIEGLYEALEPNVKSVMSSHLRSSLLLQTDMYTFLNEIVDIYVEGDSEIKKAAEAVFGKEVIITCEGFYSENDKDFLYSLEEHYSFEALGVTSSNITLYPVYRVYVPEDDVSYRYVPCRMMVETDEDTKFYTFMVQSGTTLGLPQVEGYNMYWMSPGEKSEESRQHIFEDRLSWPILCGEKQ